jgi:hypothetical protein
MKDRRTTKVLATAQDPDELALVIGWLTSEFGDRIDAAAIGRTAREEIMLFDRAKVRDFVPTISWRLARARLADMMAQDGLEPTG